MRANEFIVEEYATNLPIQEIKKILNVIKDEAEEVNDATMMFKDANDPKYKALEKDYQALTAISYVLNNNIKAYKLENENPAILDTNIFMYDVEPEDILDSGIAAIHISLNNNVAEIKWLGSYGTHGGKLMQSALNVAKSRGATSVKVDAKWNSEGFYRKMGLEQDPNAEPDRGEALRGSKLTRFKGKLEEGGWASTVTQGTVIHPSTVKLALKIVNKFINEFNTWSSKKNIPPVRVGAPTGSSAYHDVDPEDKIYGDIDLQIVVPELEELQGKSTGQIQYFWNKLFGEFGKTRNYVNPESDPGHPIVQVGSDAWVQIDFMPHPEPLAQWGRFRATPERGLKGLLYGNIFSIIGLMLRLNLQHSGVQYKTRDGERMPYTDTKKDFELHTLTTNIETFMKDIFDNEYKTITGKDPSKAKVDPLLIKYQGVNTKDPKVEYLVNAVKGLAKSFEANKMFGKGSLADYKNYNDFINKFTEMYEAKAMGAVRAPKREKAETPEAKARARADIDSILTGLEKVKGMFK